MMKYSNKNLLVISALLIVVILISGSSMSITIRDIPESKKLYLTELEKEISNGLAPQSGEIQITHDTKCTCIEKGSINEDCPLMYGINAYPEEIMMTINVCNCSVEEICDIWGGGNFVSSMTYGCDEVMYAIEYSSGILYGIDPFNCEIWSIGGGGVSLNGISWDPISNNLYGVGSEGYTDTIYRIIPETGQQIEVFELDYSGGLMIGMAFDADGVLYGWDLVSDKLWIIDIETEDVTEVGSLGININYAQDGDIHRESNTLYLTAYTGSGGLYKIDLDTGGCTLVCGFPGGWEVSGSCFLNSCEPLDHDVSIESIDYPESGYATPEIPMQVTVKNRGKNIETTDVKMQLDKYEEGPVLFEEDFSGTFPPEGWTTDFWNQSFTNEAGGESPEASVYKYDQIYGGQYYDNYIMTPPIDATGWEKVTVAFRWAANLTYPQYCSFYVKYRKNDTSPWNDISPWHNPLNEQKEGDLYEIDCYGFGDDMGTGFQLIFKFYGYYHYYNYFYLDDVEITAFSNIEDYNETVKDITLEPGEEKIVEFPTWAPDHWQDPDYENSWQDYFVKAWTLLEDEKPDNDFKVKLIELYYPWMHDIEITSIDSPCEDGPGKTYPVQATIKNIGQYAECCIPIDISIGELIVLDTLLTENAWETVPPDGWYDEHKDLDPDYGWDKSNTSYSGGSPHEARLRYHKAKPDQVLYSYAIDTYDYSALQLEFKSYLNHYSGQGLYALEAGYSTDKETWYAVWHEEPEFDENYDVECAVEGGHETLYIGFWVTGNPYYFNYWYIDDISVKVLDFVFEYSDFACQGDDLEPGESRTFEFEDWTPDYLQYETSDSKDYIVHAEINMGGDKNPDNDIVSEYFTLDYWHDPALDEVTSPNGGRWEEILWDNGDTDGSNGYSILASPERTLLDDFEVEGTWQVDGLKCYCVAGPVNTPKVGFWSDIDNEPDELVEQANIVDFNRENTGRSWFGYQEWEYQAEFDPVVVEEGRHWVEIGQTSGSNTFIMIKADYVLEEGWLKYTDYGYFMPFSQYFGVKGDLNFRLFGEAGGAPGISTYIKPGTKPITAVAKNLGTFQELDLVCNAQIWEFITDPENGTMLYEDDETDIDLDTPLGGEVPLTFEDFTFAYEGRYGLYLNMPDDNDDFPKNNKKSWGIGVDNTKPVSTHTLDPAIPDGDNGWYVSDVEVSLSAYDPLSNDVSSGIKEIGYCVNGDCDTIPGESGSFLITQEHDGDDVEVIYWAIDNVGNEEDLHMFTIDMDQTQPALYLEYEVTGGNPYSGWDLLFTAIAKDDTSGMDRVEFYLSEIWQETVYGPGPTYQWGFTYHGGLNLVVIADGYDIAGYMASDEIDPVTTYNQNTQHQSLGHPSSNIINKPQQRLFVIPGVGYR